ncbi:thymidylate synthase/dCMP hydroxymethylase domain-containing protein, partial [Suillus cothurnatus]
WRHFGANYVNCDTDYTGQGVDQLKECIRKIRDDPTDRRIIMSAWNPAADLGLGIPFNIASYALLTHMVAHVTGTKPHELIIQLGDAHVYRDHVDALEIQLKREPRSFPKLNSEGR